MSRTRSSAARAAARGVAALIHCAAGPQLLLRPALNPSGDPPANNPDHITWLRPGLALRPVSAGSPLTALTPDGTALATVSSRDGAVLRTTPLIAPAAHVAPVAPPAVPMGGWPGAAPFGVTAGTGTLLWLGADTAYLPSGATAPSWQRATRGPATVTTANTGDMLVGAAGGGVALLAPSNGALRRRWPLSTAPGDLVTAAGRGVLVGGASGTGYYA